MVDRHRRSARGSIPAAEARLSRPRAKARSRRVKRPSIRRRCPRLYAFWWSSGSASRRQSCERQSSCGGGCTFGGGAAFAASPVLAGRPGSEIGGRRRVSSCARRTARCCRNLLERFGWMQLVDMEAPPGLGWGVPCNHSNSAPILRRGFFLRERSLAPITRYVNALAASSWRTPPSRPRASAFLSPWVGASSATGSRS